MRMGIRLEPYEPLLRPNFSLCKCLFVCLRKLRAAYQNSVYCADKLPILAWILGVFGPNLWSLERDYRRGNIRHTSWLSRKLADRKLPEAKTSNGFFVAFQLHTISDTSPSNHEIYFGAGQQL